MKRTRALRPGTQTEASVCPALGTGNQSGEVRRVLDSVRGRVIRILNGPMNQILLAARARYSLAEAANTDFAHQLVAAAPRQIAGICAAVELAALATLAFPSCHDSGHGRRCTFRFLCFRVVAAVLVHLLGPEHASAKSHVQTPRDSCITTGAAIHARIVL